MGFLEVNYVVCTDLRSNSMTNGVGRVQSFRDQGDQNSIFFRNSSELFVVCPWLFLRGDVLQASILGVLDDFPIVSSTCTKLNFGYFYGSSQIFVHF